MAAAVKSNSASTGLGVKRHCNEVFSQTRRAMNIPKDIQTLGKDLQDFESKCETLKLRLENRNLSAGKTAVDSVLESPLMDCDQVTTFIVSFKTMGGVGGLIVTWRKIKYSYSGPGTDALRNELAAYKLRLSVATLLVNFLNTNIESAATRNSDAKTSIYLTGMVDKLPAILHSLEKMKSAILSSIESHPSSKRLSLVESQSGEILKYLDRETGTLRRAYHSSAVFMPPSIRNVPEDATQIFVKGPGNQTQVVHIKPSQTMGDLKRMIEARTGVPQDLLYFVSAGKVLPNEGTPQSLNIIHDSTLICNARAKGTSKLALSKISDKAKKPIVLKIFRNSTK